MTVSNHGELQVLDEIFNAGAGTFPAANPYVSLHTDDPGETGANEVAGGSYARQQADFTAASGGTLSNVSNIDFTLMPAVSAPGVVAWGVWDAASAGNCFWTGWFSTVSRVFVLTDTTNDDFVSPSHGFVADDRVVFEVVEAESLPAGVTAGTLYWVIATGLTSNQFRVSTTQGGGALNVTGVGTGLVRKVVGKVVNLNDTVRVAAGELDIFLD